jgi:protein ImuB
VLAEIGGSLRLFGGLARLKARLARGVQDLGYAPRWAFAPTSAAALLLSRVSDDFSRNSGGKNGEGRKVVSDPDAWPLSLAEADPGAIATLAAAGVTTFGAAFALPRAALARRVGTDFVLLLDRLRGLVPEVRPLFVPPPRYTGKLDLPAPVANVDALVFAVNRLVCELTGWLTGRGLGVIEMSLALAHERYVSVATGRGATSVGFSLAAPAREPAHLISVLRERLARVVLPASVESITLASEVVAPLGSRNLGLLPGDNVTATVPLLDRLRARLGEDAVTLIAPHAEHRPERASRETKIETEHSAPHGHRDRRQAARTTREAASEGRRSALPAPLAPRLAGADRSSTRSAALGAARRARADRVRVVGRRRRPTGLLHRRKPAGGNRVDLSRSSIWNRRRRMVPARPVRVRPRLAAPFAKRQPCPPLPIARRSSSST